MLHHLIWRRTCIIWNCKQYCLLSWLIWSLMDTSRVAWSLMYWHPPLHLPTSSSRAKFSNVSPTAPPPPPTPTNQLCMPAKGIRLFQSQLQIVGMFLRAPFSSSYNPQPEPGVPSPLALPQVRQVDQLLWTHQQPQASLGQTVHQPRPHIHLLIPLSLTPAHRQPRATQSCNCWCERGFLFTFAGDHLLFCRLSTVPLNTRCAKVDSEKVAPPLLQPAPQPHQGERPWGGGDQNPWRRTPSWRPAKPLFTRRSTGSLWTSPEGSDGKRGRLADGPPYPPSDNIPHHCHHRRHLHHWQKAWRTSTCLSQGLDLKMRKNQFSFIILWTFDVKFHPEMKPFREKTLMPRKVTHWIFDFKGFIGTDGVKEAYHQIGTLGPSSREKNCLHL